MGCVRLGVGRVRKTTPHRKGDIKMSLLNTVIKAKLAPGKYPISIMGIKEFENDNGGYVQLEVALPDRTIKQNFFPSNLLYLGGALRNQLGLEGDHGLKEVLDLAMKADNLFGIVSYNDYGMNLALHEVTTINTEAEVKF